ncbi:methyltransferase (DUF5641) [Popillia japonica]|uniref:Methyltransferase (DUF5641) n=1 Tax=Popillia japonica TaxID=7064 RepID=A0AAW1L7W6_POPJA
MHDAMMAVPTIDVDDIPANRLKLHQRMQTIVGHFWRRWSTEYLATLQQRTKWKVNSSNPIRKDDLVLLKEDHTPPSQWKLGRIQEFRRFRVIPTGSEHRQSLIF